MDALRNGFRRCAACDCALLASVALGLALAVFATPGLGQDAVTFVDPNLEAAVREAIGKPTGKILVSHVAGLTSLSARERGISSLEGIEHLTQLTVLHLLFNEISDLTPLSGLTQLTYLDLA